MARTANEWLKLFEQVLQRIRREAYLVVDSATVQIMLEDSLGFNFMRSLDQMLRSMGETAKPTILKVVVIVNELK